MEVIVRAQYEGYSIREVPIVFVDRIYGRHAPTIAMAVVYLPIC